MDSDNAMQLLKATGQHKKLARGGIISLVGMGLLWSLKWVPSSVPVEILVGGGVAFSLIAIIGAVCATSSVRCPKCDLAWVRWSVSHQPHNQWLRWLYRFESCPRCGYSVSQSSTLPEAAEGKNSVRKNVT